MKRPWTKAERIKAFAKNLKKFRGEHGLARDKTVRDENKARGATLCKKCYGTGNLLFAMYQRCDECEGRGYIKDGRILPYEVSK